MCWLGTSSDSKNQKIDIDNDVKIVNGSKISGQVHLQFYGEVDGSVIEGGLVQSPGIDILRIPGLVHNATAGGYGYIQGRITDNATFRGSYVTTAVGDRFTHVGQYAWVDGENSLISGEIFNEGFIQGGCRAVDVFQSYIAIGAGCDLGAILRGKIIIWNGTLEGGTLINQSFDNGTKTDL